MSWTPQQEEALQVRNRNLLLSAAAGSGKTAVLTERIIRLVKDPENHTDINQLLVLTFTKAAASEMKSRVSAALTRELDEATTAEDRPLMRHLERQITLLSSAQISTLDSFFQSLVRQYFYLLDLDPKIKILADENENHLIEEEVLSEVLERWYEEGDADFLEAADFFVSRYQDRALKDIILKLHDFSDTMAFPEVWLENLPKNYEIPEDAHLDDLPWTKPVLDNLTALLEKICDLYRQAFAVMEKNPAANAVYSEKLGEEYAFFSEAAKVSTWKALYAIPSFSFATLKGISKDQVAQFHFSSSKEFTNSADAKAIKDLRDSVKAIYTKKLSPFFSIEEDQWLRETRSMGAMTSVLARLTLDFSKAYRQRKKQEGYMDFSDSERYALELLLDRSAVGFTPERATDFPSETARSLQKKYKEVMIDEYQDTNEVQELITALVSNGKNRFMVGDIKQSIYGFRGGEPSIFADYRRAFPLLRCAEDSGQGGVCVFMSENFRCSQPVIDYANRICSFLFSACPESVGYRPQDDLVCGKQSPPDRLRPVQTLAFEPYTDGMKQAAEDAGETLPNREALWCAAEIARLIREEQLEDGSPIRPRDIAVLFRKSAPMQIWSDALAAWGIPVSAPSADDLLQSPLMTDTLNLLRAIDNPYRDLPLSEYLLTPAGGFSLEALGDIRAAEPDRRSLYDAMCAAGENPAHPCHAQCAAFVSWLEHYRSLASVQPVDRFLRLLFLDPLLSPYAATPELRIL